MSFWSRASLKISPPAKLACPSQRRPRFLLSDFFLLVGLSVDYGYLGAFKSGGSRFLSPP